MRLRFIEQEPQTATEATWSAEPDESLKRLTFGLAAFAGDLWDWDDIDAAVAGIYAMRERAEDRPVPSLRSPML